MSEPVPASTPPEAGGATVILGVGNLLHGDDGVGVHVAQRLIAGGCLDGVEVLDGGVAPLDALAAVGPVARLIIVDAADLGEAPGTIRKLGRDDLMPTSDEPVSLHDLDLLYALNVLCVTDREPQELVVIGVQPESLEWSTDLSPAVAERLDDIIEAVLAEIPARTFEREKVRP